MSTDRKISPGTVVVTTGMTVLENDDGDFGHYIDSGRFDITVLSAGYLLLVLSSKGSGLRVFSLECGKIGRLNTGSVVKYQ